LGAPRSLMPWLVPDDFPALAAKCGTLPPIGGP
jgi:hypothetical protein